MHMAMVRCVESGWGGEGKGERRGKSATYSALRLTTEQPSLVLVHISVEHRSMLRGWKAIHAI